jgi:dethiobiotin synthetase
VSFLFESELRRDAVSSVYGLVVHAAVGFIRSSKAESLCRYHHFFWWRMPAVSALMSALKPILFITGTDTGAGKTVLTALLAAHLRAQKIRVAALKPICSGGRDDARKISAALDGTLTLDEINPWHFRAPIAPLLAARREKKSIPRVAVLKHVRAVQGKFAVTIVEGAGGLLSPLGENFDSHDLIVALRATPIIVAQNKLGVVNHLLLTLAALPEDIRAAAKVVLMSPTKPDAAARTNAGLLAEFFPEKKIFTLPWLGKNFSPTAVVKKAETRQVLRALAQVSRL